MATAIRHDMARRTPAGMAEAEWGARQQLAACYRVFDHLGWVESIYNHITLRVPGEDSFLINPFGLMYAEVTASNLIKIDIDGNRLSDSPWEVNLAGFTQHATFHRDLPDAHCVMHTHTTAGMAVACSEGGLETSSFYAGQLAGRVAYHDFEGVTVRGEEGPRLIANLGARRMMILRNHGLLVMGPTVPAAFLNMFLLQRACEIQIASAALGPRRIIPDDVLAVHQRDAVKIQRLDSLGELDFAAYVRMVDRKDPSWRD